MSVFVCAKCDDELDDEEAQYYAGYGYPLDQVLCNSCAVEENAEHDEE